MKRIFTLFVLVFSIGMVVNAQKNVVVSIGKNKYSVDEFERIYKKNNTQLNDQNEVKTPLEYVDMFIDYKLKVIEAEKRGYDTVSTFIEELAGYRAELAKSYLTDSLTNEEVIKKTYFRMVNEVDASHFLIKCNPNALPADTLKAYNKALEIRNKYLNKENTFEELAIAYSEDISISENKGNLGYFNAFRMIPEVEEGAFSTPVGTISMPVRSTLGYHVILVHDLRPSAGEVKVAHIMKIFKNSKNVSEEEDKQLKSTIDSIYLLLKNGADFGQLATEFSDDKGTARRNGEMAYIRQDFGVKEFTTTAFSLKHDGDFSEPIKTEFGWHILKRIDKKMPPAFDEVKDEIMNKIRKDPYRSKPSLNAFLAKMKIENGFICYDENLKTFKNYLRSIVNDTIYADFPKEIMNLDLYKIAENNYTVSTFWDLQKIKKKNDGNFLASIVLTHLDKYEEEIITAYENEHLETKFPDFAQTMKEYREGMLLYAIMHDQVWNMAIEDSLGLNTFYEKNKGKYAWGKYFDGLLIRCFNIETKDSVQLLLAAGINSPKEIEALLNTSKVNIRVKKDKWEKGANDRIDYFAFGGPMPNRFESELEFVVGDIKEGGVKTLEEAMAYYIADYQQELEKRWLKELRLQYPIIINKKLLKKIKSL